MMTDSFAHTPGGAPRTCRIGGSMGIAALLLAACAPSYDIDMSVPMRDGQWSAQSNPDDQGAVGQLTITVENGDITSSVYETIEQNGTTKDEDYGKDSSGRVFNGDYYAKAQKAVESFAAYSKQLTETDDPREVDVISGATVAHSQFMQAAIRAVLAAQGVDDPHAADSISIPGLKDTTDLGNGDLDEDLGGTGE